MSPALLHAYRSTSYNVEGIEVRIGRRSPAMDRLLRSHAAREAIFLTAYNPFSRIMPPGWNRRIQTRLRLAVRRHKVLSGTGFWRRWSEAHLVVFADARPVRRLARRFRQHGVVVVRRGQPARFHPSFIPLPVPMPPGLG